MNQKKKVVKEMMIVILMMTTGVTVHLAMERVAIKRYIRRRDHLVGKFRNRARKNVSQESKLNMKKKKRKIKCSKKLLLVVLGEVSTTLFISCKSKNFHRILLMLKKKAEI